MKKMIPFNKNSYRSSHLSMRGARSRDRFQRFLQTVVLFSFLLSLSLLMTGCPSSLKLLDKFKKEAAAGNYEWIASQPVDCSGESEDCRQLHLIKGDAHYALAKQGKDEITNYTHASEELALGIKLTNNWDNPSNRS